MTEEKMNDKLSPKEALFGMIVILILLAGVIWYATKFEKTSQSSGNWPVYYETKDQIQKNRDEQLDKIEQGIKDLKESIDEKKTDK